MGMSTFPTAIDTPSGGVPLYDDAIVAIETAIIAKGVPGAVNALGVVGATAQLALGFNTLTTGASNVTLDFPASPAVGAMVSAEITQGATARTLTLSPTTLDAGGTDPALTATPAAVDYFEWKFDGTNWVTVITQKNLS